MILDWNTAADLAFDSTLVSFRQQWVGLWLGEYLDDPLAAAEHGQRVFGDERNLPWIDVENQHFTSEHYGPIDMTKRAFFVPNDNWPMSRFIPNTVEHPCF